MAQILIRNLDEETVTSLKRLAAGHGRSLQAEVKNIVEEAARHDPEAGWAAVERFRRRMVAAGRHFTDSAEQLREERER